MKERFDLKEMLKEIEQEDAKPTAPQKNAKVTQQDINKLFKIKKQSKTDEK